MDHRAAATRITEITRATQPVVVRLDGGAPFGRRVAVIPAAFNPPTRAHLALLRTATLAAGADGGATLLSVRNVDKGDEGAPMPDRVLMLSLARSPAILATNAARIADQAVALRQAFPRVEWDIVVGYDTLVRLFEPRYYGGLGGMHVALGGFFAQHRVVVANRGSGGVAEVTTFLSRPEVERYRARIVSVAFDSGLAEISSTAARRAAAFGQAIPGVPVEVAAYVAAQGLYRHA